MCRRQSGLRRAVHRPGTAVLPSQARSWRQPHLWPPRLLHQDIRLRLPDRCACLPPAVVRARWSQQSWCMPRPPPPAPLAMSAWATLRRPVQTICCLQARCAATAASCPSPAARATQWWLRAAAPACAPLMAACAPASAQVRGTVCPTGFCTHRAYYGMWSCITARHPGSPRLTQMTPEAAAEQP